MMKSLGGSEKMKVISFLSLNEIIIIIIITITFFFLQSKVEKRFLRKQPVISTVGLQNI